MWWRASDSSKSRICGGRWRRRGLDEAVDFDKALFVGTRDLIVQKPKARA